MPEYFTRRAVFGTLGVSMLFRVFTPYHSLVGEVVGIALGWVVFLTIVIGAKFLAHKWRAWRDEPPTDTV